MKYRKIGNLEVSAVGLGCMGMSHAYGEPSDRKEMIELLSKAVDIGYTFLMRLKSMARQIIHMIMKKF